jgi:pimeloyl-ACP methyl ester carboxylesterase
MQSHYITFKNSTVHYRKFGNGSKLLFCFHGYGRESDTFYILERRLGSVFTIIAIDIPFHGLTDWKEEIVLKPEYLQQFLLQIRTDLNKDNIKFSLLGFSMGGRIALHLTQLMSELVERLILLAPDGLNFNFWRWMASDTWLGNKLMNYTIHNGRWVAAALNKAEKWHIIHRSLTGFLSYYLDNEEYRIKFYHRYIAMQKFRPSLSKLKQLIKKYRIPVKMMFGRYDQVIPYVGGEKFREGIEEFASVKIVDAGHHLLSESHADKIAQLING